MSVSSWDRDNQKHLIKLDHALNPSEELLISSTYFYFYVSRLKTVVSDNGGTHAYAARRMLLFKTFYTRISLHTQRCACTYGHRRNFANYAFHPQKQGPDHRFREGSQDGSSWLMAVSSLARRRRGPGSDLPNIPFVCCRSADVTT